MNKYHSTLICIILSMILTGCSPSKDLITPLPTVFTEKESVNKIENTPQVIESILTSIDLDNIPAYSGEPYTVINNNQPFFTDSDYSVISFETYSPLDSLGRCGTAYANIGVDIMPTEDRGKIGMIKPSGWHTVRYDNIDGKYLYNRCHLIGYQLSGENANEQNLITGTRYLNVMGMLPFENMTADYVKETNNHVLYRVTPVFKGNNLLASGVLMEGWSVEDNGSGICYNVFCYNIQPGIEIDYATGESHAIETVTEEPTVSGTDIPVKSNSSVDGTLKYIGNKNTKKFHYPYCSSVNDMEESNKVPLYCSRDEAIAKGYSPCKICNP